MAAALHNSSSYSSSPSTSGNDLQAPIHGIDNKIKMWRGEQYDYNEEMQIIIAEWDTRLFALFHGHALEIYGNGSASDDDGDDDAK